MTKAEFRDKHSEIIEYYQYIEMRLRGICSVLLSDEERGWLDRLSDYETDSLGLLINKIKSLQIQKQEYLLSADDFTKLEDIRRRRNYWVHNCFIVSPKVIFRKNIVTNIELVKQFKNDHQNAVEWDEKLTQIFFTYTQKYRQ